MDFLNTFQNGLYKDSSLTLQPDGTYRDMRNFNLITQDGNNYTIEDVLGNRLTFTLPQPYNGNTSTLDTEPMPIGFISFVDKLIVFFTTPVGTDNYGQIGMFDYTEYGQGVQATTGYTPLYHHKNLKFSINYKIEGFGLEESENKKRAYWTDFYNEPRVIDIANPIFTTYYLSGSLSASSGSQYMVLQGAIEYPAASSNFYGPGLTLGNVFTTNGINTTYNTIAGSPLVIAYFPYQLLSWSPSRALGNIDFQEYGSGNVVCGSKMYFYRLKSTSSSYSTSWSYGSNLVHVSTSNSVTASPANTYFNEVGAGSQTTTVTSTKSVKMLISNIDTNFDTIELACAEFDQLVGTPRQIPIVVSTTITGTSMTLEHTGNNNFGTLTLDDIELFPASILACKTITTNKNYIIAANLTERTELSFDKTGVTLTEIVKMMPVHEFDNACPNIQSYNDVSPSTVANPPLVDGIWPYTQWMVVSGGPCTYNATVYNNGDVFEGVPGVYNWANTSGTTVLRPCVFKNRYTDNSSVNHYDSIQLKTAHWNYKDPAVDFMVKGLWHKEVYRYGVLFYDLKGNPFYVRWIGDLTTTQADYYGLSEKVQNTSGSYMLYLKAIGCRVSGLKIKGTEIDKISGFSIVRAPRDRRVISQGMLMQCGKAGSTPDVIYPLASPYLDTTRERWSNPSTDIFFLVCPDHLDGVTTNSTLGTGFSVGSFIEEAVWQKADVYTAGTLMKSSSDDDHSCEARYFEHEAVDASGNTRSNKIINGSVFNEGTTWTDVFGITGVNFYNGGIEFNAHALATSDAACKGGGTQTQSGRKAVGGKKFVIQIEGGLPYYGNYSSILPANQYYAINAAPSNHYSKLIVNVAKAPFTQYGGTSDAALANTLYISTGHFQPIDATVKSQTINGSGDYVFNNIDVWGGDAYVNLVDYGYSLYDDTLGPSYSWQIKFPCQSNSNYDLRRGRTTANNRMNGNGTGVVYSEGGQTRLEDFSYNEGYSSDGSTFTYPALPVNYISAGRFKYRARFAGPKYIGEQNDSFRIFRTNDYADVDGLLGEINNVRAKGDRVIYWQNHGVGSTPIKERQILSGTNGAATSLGTGGVLDAFYTISNFYGNQHQHGLFETDGGYMWFDMRNKDVCILDSGLETLTTAKGLKSFFNEVFFERGSQTFSINLLNDPTYARTSDMPLTGVGIIGVYDPKLEMSYMTFKFKNEVNLPGTPSVVTILNKDFTIAYHHKLGKFIGFYDKYPAIWHRHNQIVLSANNAKNIQNPYNANMPATTYNVGDINAYNYSEYICKTSFTLNSYSTPINSNFVKINGPNEIYVENQEASYSTTPPGYAKNLFYGRVVDNSIEIIINPKEGPMSVTNYEMGAVGDNITDITISADSNQTGTESSIKSWNRSFLFKDGSWWGSLPLTSKGARITDKYLKVKFTKKNWVTDPTVEAGLRTVIQFVKSFFERKR